MSATRTVRVAGADVTYTGTVVEFVVSDGAGRPGARYVCTEYVREVAPEVRATRPVLFVFNGGPGSSSVWTHLGLGPRRVAGADSLDPAMTPPFALADNEDSPLDVADLVFVDPPGTGYSRLLDGAEPEAFYGTEQDARATLELIELWVRRNRRENAPRFLVGESYGTLRAARMVRLANGGPFRGGATRPTSINGVVVLGPSLTTGEDAWTGDVRAALELPTLVTTARRHGADVADGADIAESDEKVAWFARHELLPALAAGSDLPDDERRALAERMAALLGLDAATVLAHDLRITPGEFARLVLARDGRHAGAYDSRFTLPADGAGADVVADDPGMGRYMPQFLGSIEPYLRDELGHTTEDDYRGIAFADVNSRWDYGHGPGRPPASPPFAEFAEALRRDPSFELLLGVGDYDLVTTPAATTFALSRHRFDRGRVHVRRYASGHMPYLGAQPRAALAADIRQFVARLSRA